MFFFCLNIRYSHFLRACHHSIFKDKKASFDCICSLIAKSLANFVSWDLKLHNQLLKIQQTKIAIMKIQFSPQKSNSTYTVKLQAEAEGRKELLTLSKSWEELT